MLHDENVSITVIEHSPEQVSPSRKKVHFNFEQQENIKSKAYDDDIDFMKENVSSNSHDKVIQNYCEVPDIQNVSELPMGTQNLINELNYQASKVATVEKRKADQLVFNLSGKKAKSCKTGAERMKNSR